MIHFKDIKKEDSHVGGKAYVLGQMLQAGMEVPPGLVLSSPPDKETQEKTLSWWNSLGQPKLAVRSSACGEDSEELSYAGQQKTFLNVGSSEELLESIRLCFDSTKRDASRAYRKHFGEQEEIAMNVVLQEMISPKYSGVYFSSDPRSKERQPLIEITEGLGEKLVSGQVNPYRIRGESETLPEGWEKRWTSEILQAGVRGEKLLNTDVDMEWCIDEGGKLWVLQARPVTATSERQENLIHEEMERLKSASEDSIWDGQTFSDWTSTVTELTFDVWRDTFSTRGAFCRAMRELGYFGYLTGDDEEVNSQETVLERVFGKAYINLTLLEPLFFGEIPYRIVSTPRPHLKFDPRRITLKMIFNTPRPLWRMLKVGWRLRTRRLEEIAKARKLLGELKGADFHAVFSDHFEQTSDEELFELWLRKKRRFSEETMKWPFVLTFLIESTLQSLQVMLEKVEGENAKLELQNWLSVGLSTKTSEMSDVLRKYTQGEMKKSDFLSEFGHRGPGEMELSRPRWSEIPPQKSKFVGNKKIKVSESVEERIGRYGKMRGAVILQEWQILKELLELREEWKNEILKPYGYLRYLALELGSRLKVGENIFWLNSDEISRGIADGDTDYLQSISLDRKERTTKLSNVNLPSVFSLTSLEQQINGETGQDDRVFSGESLSIGLAYGTAVYMDRPDEISLDELPEDLVLITHSIDPGWTPVFSKAKAILTETGGVLSHAAIVAREMGIPAISQLNNLKENIPTGTALWVDGTHGRIAIGKELGEGIGNEHH